jgi:hypothetical protein
MSLVEQGGTTFALLPLRGAVTHQTRAGIGQMTAFLASGDLLMPFRADPASRLPDR